MDKSTIENDKGSEAALEILDSLIEDTGHGKINESQLFIILDALASSDDAEVVARFPAVLAICARRGLPLNSHALFARYWESSPKRQNLEKLLLVSAALFNLEGLEPPKNLEKIAASLTSKYGDLASKRIFQLSSGMYISLRALQKKLRAYAAEHPESPVHQPKPTPARPANLESYLDRLFSPKQKELVLKKRDGKSFTKTEREYYSRTVRKKLEAIASEEVGGLAKQLTHN